ncbi:MAG: TRAP transporter large permease [Clostridia bacterium]|nr:TRAP transporter large permease [Clostridia bacterium]
MIAAIGIFFVFLLLGMPVAFAIGISGWSFFMIRELPLSIMVQKSISTTQSFTMLAIPLFILAGNLMNATGITKRLMNLASVLCGHMYGSVGQVSCVLSTLMGGVSGSAVADAAMQCRILGPEMTKLGYSRGWSAAVNGLSGLIVATIPPSMGLIIYGTTGEVSIGRLFMAGWFPGVLMMTFLMIAVRWSARKFGYKPERAKMAPASEIIKVVLDAIWAILFPIMLILLIRFGIMSPTESGAFACAYALFVGMVIYREMTMAVMMQTLKDSVKDVTVIAIILCFSGVFGYGVVFDDLTTTLATALVAITSNKVALLFLVILFLLICGCFMETTVIALILTPILKPVMESVGVDPVVFGMIMMTCVTFGVMTPPVGTGLYTTADIMGCSIQDVVKDGWPFYLAVILVVVVMVFFPDAVLFLPNLVYGA